MSTVPKTRHPRHSTKTAPFSSSGDANDLHDCNGNKPRQSQAYSQRLALTTSIRKSKRGQTVALKRHVSLSLPSSMDAAVTDTINMNTEKRNRYRADADRASETIEIAKRIVNLCSGELTAPSSSPLSSVALVLSLLERICFLLTPDNREKGATKGSALDGLSDRGLLSFPSFDSSSSGIAANALLSCFINEPNNVIQSSTERSTTMNLAYLFANSLAFLLNKTQISETFNRNTFSPHLYSVRIHAAIAATQLAATEPPPPLYSNNERSLSYETQEPSPPSELAPTSWCHVLVHSHALAALVQNLPSPSMTYTNYPEYSTDFELCAKCIWAIGNLAGDSEMAREALRQMGAVSRLITSVSLGLSVASEAGNAQRKSVLSALINLVRNSVWALTNLVRGGGMPSTEILLFNDISTKINQVYRQGLSPASFSELLSSPECFADSHNVSESVSSTSTWNDVATEACWLLVFLTSRDPAAVDFLCRSDDSSVVPMLVKRLICATDIATHYIESTQASDSHGIPKTTNNMTFGEDNSINLSASFLCLIPCCRALRNIAIASDGRYVQQIFCSGTFAVDSNFSTDTYLSKLIALGSLGLGDHFSSIANEAAATAGACLLDAGFPSPHHSTDACRTLIPALCEALISPYSKANLLREVLWALWYAVDYPSVFSDKEGIIEGRNVVPLEVENVQKGILREIILFSPDEVTRSLTAMLSSFDSESVEASLRLIDVLLRRLEKTIEIGTGEVKLSVLFDESGLVEALEHICDYSSGETLVAEISAELLDDFFEEGEEEEDMIIAPVVAGGIFQFQSPGVASVPEGGFSFGQNSLLQRQVSPQSMGRGRGRGQILPAWLQQQQPQQQT